MLLPLLLAAVDPLVAACHDDDAGACHALGVTALDTAGAAGRAEALQHFRHACALGNGPSCAEAATLLDEREPALAAELRERASRLPDLTLGPPAEAPRVAPEPPPERIIAVRDDLRDDEAPTTGSRWGAIGFVAGKVNPQGAGLAGGLGVRYGLRERTTEPMMFMPALGLVAGFTWDRTGLQPSAEVRLELMGARPGGALMTAFGGWVSTGVELRPSLFGRLPMQPPLQGHQPGPSPVRPYLGFGSGWNWMPRGAPSPTGKTLVVWLFLLPVIIAGRVELRVSPPMTSADSTELTLMVGCGL